MYKHAGSYDFVSCFQDSDDDDEEEEEEKSSSYGGLPDRDAALRWVFLDFGLSLFYMYLVASAIVLVAFILSISAHLYLRSRRRRRVPPVINGSSQNEPPVMGVLKTADQPLYTADNA